MHEQQRLDVEVHIDMKPENWCKDDGTMWQTRNYGRNCELGEQPTDLNSEWCVYEQSNNLSPYDHLSILHYSGNDEDNDCGPLFTYRVRTKIKFESYKL